MGWEWKIIKNCPQNYQIIEYIWILFGSFPKNWRKEWGNPKKCQFLGFAKFALIISRNNISHHVVRNSHFAKFLSIVFHSNSANSSRRNKGMPYTDTKNEEWCFKWFSFTILFKPWGFYKVWQKSEINGKLNVFIQKIIANFFS